MGFEWRELRAEGGTGPGPRSSHTINVHKDKVLIWGGERVSRTPTDSLLHVYDLHTRQWTELVGAQCCPSRPGPDLPGRTANPKLGTVPLKLPRALLAAAQCAAAQRAAAQVTETLRAMPS